MKRVFEKNEQLLLEDEAEYIGGHSKVLESLKGKLVLSNRKIILERIVGGVRHKRPEIIFIIDISEIKELKLSESGRLTKPAITVVYEYEEKLEQPAFTVSSRESWSSAISSIKIGRFTF